MYRYALAILVALLPLFVKGQDDWCTGPTFFQQFRDGAGRDVRLTCVIDYGAQGDLLVGGMAGGDVVLQRLDTEGNRLWQRSFSTNSESTELTLLNDVLIDREGMIAGVVSYFRDNAQYALLFRYDPIADRLLYLRQSPFEADPTGIQLDADGNYLICGGKVNLPDPVFRQSYLQRFDRRDGRPLEPGQLLDLRGEETIFDLLPLPDGGFLATGQVSVMPGVGGGRAQLLWLDENGRVERSLIGSRGADETARLFGFDVEVLDGRIYVLHWGDLDRITGAMGTSPQISAFDAAGGLVWHRVYDLREAEGEIAMEMVPHDGGLVVYGYTLVGGRKLFLFQIDPLGEVEWARSFDPPGAARVYQRANRQLLSRGDRLLLTATYDFAGERPQEGLLLQLDREGRPFGDCLPTLQATVVASSPSARWFPAPVTNEPANAAWETIALPRPPAPELSAYDDCDVPCEPCTRRTYRQLAVCSGDSLFVAGRWRTSPGRYSDTLPSVVPDCDSITTVDLLIAPPLSATYRQLPNCGSPLQPVEVTAAGGLAPYRYRWSAPADTAARVSLEPGSYTVTVSSTAGCGELVLAVRVEAGADTRLDLRGRAPSCAESRNGSVVLIPAGTGSLKLLNDSTFLPDSIPGLAPGVHAVIVRLAGGCEVYREVTVPAAPAFGVELRGPDRARLGDLVTFGAASDRSAPGLSYNWTADTTLICQACPDFPLRAIRSTPVTVTVADARGCTATDSTYLIVTAGEPRLYVPTGFSPNGDGTNDRWEPGFGPEVAEVLYWRVYDRWGSRVWSYDPAAKQWWGGDAGAGGVGRSVASGVYLYRLSVRLIDGTVAEDHGEVTVVR